MNASRSRGAQACLLALFVGAQTACGIFEDIVAENEPSPGHGGGSGFGAAGGGAAGMPTGSGGTSGSPASGGGSGLAGAGGNLAGAGGARAGSPAVAGASGDAGAAGFAGAGAGTSGAGGIAGAGAGGASAGDGGGGSGGTGPTEPPCGLDSRAFCDPLTSAATGGRAGDLDETRWHAARLAQNTNATAGPFVGWFPAETVDCSGEPRTLGLENDLIVCNGGARSGLLDALHVDANYNLEVDRTLSVRQQFLFENRTGRIVFDLGSTAPIQRVNVWLTRDVSTGLGQSTVVPFGSLRVRISSGACSGNRAGLTVTAASLETVSTVPPDAPVPCFETGSGELVRYQIQVARDHVEVLAVPPGGSEFVRLGRYTTTLAFGRGYLHLVHGESYGDSERAPVAIRWANVGFDGPTRAAWRSYDFPNSLTPVLTESGATGYVDMGYPMRLQPTALTIDGVDVSGQLTAVFSFNVFGRPSSDAPLEMRWNGNAARYYYTSSIPSSPWQAISLSVPVSLLQAGTNRLELSSGAQVVVANLRLHLEQPEPG